MSEKKVFVKGRAPFCHSLDIPQQLIDIIIEEYAEDIESRPLMVGKTIDGRGEDMRDDGSVNISTRNCELEWIPTTGWLAPLIWYHVKGINDQYFEYDIKQMENIQLTSYSPGEYYHWHTDSHLDKNPIDRKLTCVVQLSDESDYEGGELQILHPGYSGMEVGPKKKGTLIVFDSRLAHRVRPIKSGKRIAAVCWALGPKWR